MASPTLLKLLRNRTATKIPTFIRQTFASTQIPQFPKPYDTAAFSNPIETDYFKPNHSFGAPVYPSFPFGYFLAPASQAPSIQAEMGGELAPDESNVIWADSVKKKRKKKMNKHKLRKLRKRLRKKT